MIIFLLFADIDDVGLVDTSRSLDFDSSLLLLVGSLRLIMVIFLPFVDIVDVGIADTSRSLDLDNSLLLLAGRLRLVMVLFLLFVDMANSLSLFVLFVQNRQLADLSN